MSEYQWHEAIAQLEPYIFRIYTPDGSGTGWLVSRSKTTPLCVIATASHVLDHAYYWEEPIRLHHHSSGKAVLLRPGDRAINIDTVTDTTAIIMNRGELDLPDVDLPMIKKDYHLKPGVDIGWLGFPAIPWASLCFFSGHISAYLDNEAAYLVDGVAINGVSGGPAFYLISDSAELIGVVSAYIPNRATGDILPGVALVRDVNRFHDLAEGVRTLDEAQAQQSPPIEPPPPAADAEPGASRRSSGAPPRP